MVLAPRLDLRQTQSLVMTPQLQQAIKFLQLSNLELNAAIEAELERNPLLEKEDGPEFGEDDIDSSQTDDPAGRNDDETLLDADPSGSDVPLDVDYDNAWPDDDTSKEYVAGDSSLFDWGNGGGSGGSDNEDFNSEQTAAHPETLREHLLKQINIELNDPVDRIIGLHLVDMLDETGYLRGDLAALGALLGCDASRIEATLEKVQRFDPPGLFARSLSECLALQLREKDRLDPAMQALLDNLDMLAHHDMAGLMRVCGVDAEDMTGMIAEIRSLNPKPALAFDTAVTQSVIPDVLMRPNPAGGWIVELNSETLPRVLVNERYYTAVTRNALTKEEKAYISERFQSASWLVRALHQRATTILKVAAEIVDRQEMFFLKGIQYMRPLVLRDIAEAVELHESTISRVTTNKYIATPRGLYELKYFFTQAIGGANGETHSAEAVRHRIKLLIDAETPKAVLSDDRLVEMLKSEGIDLARRTVAKYREQMKIPSSVQRRREKSEKIF